MSLRLGGGKEQGRGWGGAQCFLRSIHQPVVICYYTLLEIHATFPIKKILYCTIKTEEIRNYLMIKKVQFTFNTSVINFSFISAMCGYLYGM